ncbi:hypothetical protein B0H13DRAFT_2335085 [Mycena leptocephala]|nr:hypothetical protein B0H13DRAFT_2335085 [Mycena leptocephala]
MSYASSPPSLSPACISTDTTSTLIELLTNLIRALAQFLVHAPSHASPPPRRPFVCSYCSDPAHFIRHCPYVAHDIRAGICQRNAQGKVVLPSGLFVPHHIPGLNLRTRITEYHRQSITVTSPAPSLAPFVSATPVPSPTSAAQFTSTPSHESALLRRSSSTAGSVSNTSPHNSFSTSPSPPPVLDPDEIRITEIERELASLRAEPPAVVSTSQPSNTAPTSSPALTEVPHNLSHPQSYRYWPDSQRPNDIPGYAPPTGRNFGLPPSPPPRKIAKPAPESTSASSAISYASSSILPCSDSAPASDPDPDALYTITLRDLLALPPDARSQILSATSAAPASDTPQIAYPFTRVPHVPVDVVPPGASSFQTYLDKYYADFKQRFDSQLARIASRVPTSN